MKKFLLLLASHGLVLALGFALGIYVLPILVAPPAPTNEQAALAVQPAAFRGQFHRDLKDSDLLHWGEGEVAVGRERIVLRGRLAPGPDYKLYLSPEFVETEAEFLRLKPQMQYVGDVRTFENFVVPVPATVDVSQYKAVIVWCETFSQFITAASYQ
ncbi:DM13 domain-containing protein [Hylemonella sp. W303a]|uniref:DM13 domain-containing protein n=1 Tax=Hylemonella sp. W303a TaxID=3389873 RepID=UPI00396B28ED